MLVRRVTRAGDLRERLAHREMGHGGSWIVDDDTVSIRQLCALPIAAEYGRQEFARPEAPSLFRTGTFSFSRYVMSRAAEGFVRCDVAIEQCPDGAVGLSLYSGGPGVEVLQESRSVSARADLLGESVKDYVELAVKWAAQEWEKESFSGVVMGGGIEAVERAKTQYGWEGVAGGILEGLADIGRDKRIKPRLQGRARLKF